MLFEVFIVQDCTIVGSKGITIGDHSTSAMPTNPKTLTIKETTFSKPSVPNSQVDISCPNRKHQNMIGTMHAHQEFHKSV